MKKRRSGLFLLSLLLVLGLILGACGGEEPTPTPEPIPPTSTPAPTSTPLPTNTPVPTETPEPTATPDATAGFVELESAEGGYMLRYPGDWFTAEMFGFTTIASNEELLDAPEPGEEGGVLIIIPGDRTEFGDASAVEVLNAMADEFDLAEDAEIVDGPTSVSINGQDGATAVIRGTTENDTPIAAYIATVMSNDRVVVVIAATPQDSESEFFPIFESIAETIEVGEPEVVELDLPDFDLPEPEGILLYGDTVSGVISEASPSVWSFIGIEGEVIDLLVQPLDIELDVVVDVLDESGTSILGGEFDESFGLEEILALSIPSTGDFFIVLSGFDDTVGEYELTIVEAGVSQTGDVFASVGALAYGDTVNSAVTEDGPSVWTFSGNEGDIINIAVNPFDESLDAVVDVLDASGASILSSGEVDDSFGLEEINNLILPYSGEFSITTRGFDGSTGDYRLTLAEAGEVAGVSGQMQYGDVEIGTVAFGVESIWGFVGEEGDFIDITVVPLDDEFDLVLDVVDETGRSILEDGPVDASFDVENIRVLRLPESGAYGISISGFDGATGEYEVELNLSNGGLPGTIIFVTDSLQEADETHAFPFLATQGEVVTIQVAPEFELDVVVQVYNDDTDELLDEIDFSTGFEELVFVTPEDGLYYFQVSGYEGSVGTYDVTLLSSDFVIMELASGDVAVGNFAAGADGYIEYMYGGLSGEVINFTVETDEDLDLVLSITDEDDNVLVEVDDNFSGESETLTYTVAEEGIVFIRVSNFFESEGEFYFSIDSE